jgi:hypothetical protein
LLALLALWTLGFLRHGIDQQYLMGSFLHLILGGHTGAEVEGHDWEYLLGATGLISHDVTLGRLSFALGALTMLVALGWGGVVLWRQGAGRQAP